jgi:hypothetical protein
MKFCAWTTEMLSTRVRKRQGDIRRKKEYGSAVINRLNQSHGISSLPAPTAWQIRSHYQRHKEHYDHARLLRPGCRR